MSSFQKETTRAAVGPRSLSPIWENVADENDVVMKCAHAFKAAFDENPAAPRLRDIARKVGCSRNAVKDHLADAQRRGMLSLSLRLPKRGGLSQDLAQKYGLAEAVVTLTPSDWNDQKSIRSALAQEVMRYFERFCIRLAEVAGEKKLLRIGIDGGLTLYQAVRETGLGSLPEFKYELIPLVFGPLGDSKDGPKFTASTVANLLGSRLEARGADVVVREGFAIKADWNHGPRKRGRVHFAIEMTGKRTVSQLDLLFVGIGSRKAGLLQREVHLLPRDQRAKMELFGDILNLAFDREGRALESIARSRAVLLSLEDLKNLSKSPSALVVGAAGGKDKVDAIRTVLRCGYISVLITDADTASALIET